MFVVVAHDCWRRPLVKVAEPRDERPDHDTDRGRADDTPDPDPRLDIAEVVYDSACQDRHHASLAEVTGHGVHRRLAATRAGGRADQSRSAGRLITAPHEHASQTRSPSTPPPRSPQRRGSK